MKKILLGLLGVLIIVAVIGAWMFLGSGTDFSSKKEILYIRSHAANKQSVLDSLKANKIVSNFWAFGFLADRLNYWQNIKPGKYEIEKGTSLLNLVRMLRNGRQTPVNFTITKLRTKEDLARLAGNKFEFDSTDMINFLNTADSLKKYGVDTTTVMTLVLPDTYTYFWNTTPDKVLRKIATASEEFWTPEKKAQATAQGLTPMEAYTLASIVEEETTNQEEKGKVASVYLNRKQIGMPLQADPTIKFALRNFGLKRIYEKYTFVESPYNTYRNKGLPPGPICTPSRQTIEAVLQAPKTGFLYFVASPTFKQQHDFSVTYEEHMQKAKAYQQALNEQDSIRKTKAPQP